MDAALPWFSRAKSGTGMVLLELVSIFLISTESWTHTHTHTHTQPHEHHDVCGGGGGLSVSSFHIQLELQPSEPSNMSAGHVVARLAAMGMRSVTYRFHH